MPDPGDLTEEELESIRRRAEDADRIAMPLFLKQRKLTEDDIEQFSKELEQARHEDAPLFWKQFGSDDGQNDEAPEKPTD